MMAEAVVDIVLKATSDRVETIVLIANERRKASDMMIIDQSSLILVL